MLIVNHSQTDAMAPLRLAAHRIAGILIAALVLGASSSLVAAADEGLSEAQKAAVEALIERYIAEHPDRILDSVRAYSKKKEEEAKAAAASNVVALSEEILRDPKAPFAGNPDGDVTVVEFFDYRCGYCKRSLDMVMTLIKEDENLRFVFKEFPILSPESRRAAQAALASAAQGKYLEFHYALMNSRGNFEDQQIMDIAAEVGLDVDRLASDMESAEIASYLDSQQELARALDISGTPTFIVEGTIIRGAVEIEALRKAIEEERQG
jgi:protein-disulfide isomerase